MKKATPNKKSSEKKETVADLKDQSTNDQAVKKGYNEKNPAQPQGAFKPDAANPKN
jgi:hypothetical protein